MTRLMGASFNWGFYRVMRINIDIRISSSLRYNLISARDPVRQAINILDKVSSKLQFTMSMVTLLNIGSNFDS